MEIQNQLLLDLYKDSKTVFPLSFITLKAIKDGCSRMSLLQKLNYYVKNGSLINVRRGIYAKPGYDEKELACSIYSPAYLSLEYILQRAGVVFQYNEAMTCVSYLSRSLRINDIDYVFRKIKNEILIDTRGIITKDNIHIATPERAFLDIMYLEPNYFFDNLKPLDKTKVFNLLPIYNCRKLDARVFEIFNGIWM